MIVKKRNITDFGIISYECRSAENLIDGGDGVTIPPVVAQILSGDSTSPLTRDGHGCPKLNAQRLCMDAKPTKRSYGKGDSAFCRIALLGFAIRINAPVNIDEGKNQRD